MNESAHAGFREELLQALDGRIKRVWVSPVYLIAMLVVSVAMVLLPLIYLGIVAAVGYGVYFHATENVDLVMLSGRLSARFVIYKVIFLYILPLIVGVTVLVFLAKPFLARPARRESRLSLVRENDPLLFDFVDRLCKAVGAPAPKRIDVDCTINASASFRRGIWSLFLPGDLVLSIGAPLVAGLTLPQFAGVLAHEFGHFSQGIAMRLSFIIRTINAWFFRLVHERDEWDERLMALSDSESGLVSLAFLIARLCIWLTRLLLRALMFVGHAISCVLMRQMEYDADRHNTRLVGSVVFEETTYQLTLLNMASQIVFGEMNEAWKDGRLPDNIPAVLAARTEEAPQSAKQRARESLQDGRTGLFDTHPSDAVRVRQSAKEDTPGMFHVAGPASLLFSDFDGLCKSVTMFHYRDILGDAVSQTNLISTADLVRRRRDAKRGREAADRFFCGSLTAVRPIRIDPYSKQLKQSAESALTQLKRARGALGKSRAIVADTFHCYLESEHARSMLQTVDELAKVGIKLDPKTLDLESSSATDTAEERSKVLATIRSLDDQIIKIESVMRLRLESAIALLGSTELDERIPKRGALRKRCDGILDLLMCFHDAASSVGQLRRAQPAFRVMCQVFAEDPEAWNETLQRPIQKLATAQYDAISNIRSILGDRPYPFKHASGSITLTEFVIGKMPARSQPFEVAACVERVVDHADSLYERLMAELALIAEKVEASVGLKPLSAEPRAEAPAV